jgi:hypothetical protein
MRACGDISDRGPRFHRRTFLPASARDDSGERLHRQIHGRVVAIGAVLAEAGNRTADQFFVNALQCAFVETEAIHDPRTKVLDHHICLA